MPNPTMLKSTITFWEATLRHDKFLMGPSSQTLVEHTVKYLKELQQIKGTKQDAEEKTPPQEGYPDREKETVART